VEDGRLVRVATVVEDCCVHLDEDTVEPNAPNLVVEDRDGVAPLAADDNIVGKPLLILLEHVERCEKNVRWRMEVRV
jgi:hypothetical protein